MFDQQIMDNLSKLYNPKKEVNGQMVDKTLDEIEQEIITILNQDLSVIELSPKEIQSYYESYRNHEIRMGYEPKELNIEETTREEYNQRLSLNKRARQIYIKQLVHKGLIEKKKAKLIENIGQSISRKASNLIFPNVDNMSFSEVDKFIEDFPKMTGEERLACLRNKMNSIENLMNDLAKCKTDEELVNVIENKFSIVNHLGEFDVNIEDLKTSLGIPLEQSDIDRINHLKYPGMYFATMLNKFSVIASPYYPKYKDMPSISQLSFELADMLDNLPPKCARLFNATFDFPGYKREMGHYFSTFTQLGANVNFIKGEFQRKVFDNIMMIRLQKFEAPTFKTLNGIDLPLAEATSELQHKRYVDVYSSHKFVARIKLTPDEFISEFEKPFKMDLKKGDAIILQTRLQEMKEALDSCNPKHVRFEAAIHIGNSGKYQKVVDELDKLLKTDLSKPIEVEKSLKKISEGINDYLVEKTRDGKTKVELTNKREDVMLKAYNFFKPLADQNAVLLEAQVSTKEQLDFLDKVQTTILTDEPENAEDTVPFDDDKSTDAVIEKDI